jgi:hypothetical protein
MCSHGPWPEERSFQTFAGGQGSLAENRFDVPAATQHAKNHDVVVLNAIDDDVFAHGKAPDSGAQIVIAFARPIFG